MGRYVIIDEDPPDCILGISWIKIKKLIAHGRRHRCYFTFEDAVAILQEKPIKVFHLLYKLSCMEMLLINLDPMFSYPKTHIEDTFNVTINENEDTIGRVSTYLSKNKVLDFYIQPKTFKLAQRRLKRTTIDIHLKNCLLLMANMCDNAAKYGGWDALYADWLKNNRKYSMQHLYATLTPSDIIIYGSYLNKERQWLGDVDLAVTIPSGGRIDILKEYLRKNKIYFVSLRNLEDINFMFDGTDYEYKNREMKRTIHTNKILLSREEALNMPDLGAAHLREIASNLSLIFNMPEKKKISPSSLILTQ